jgi:hypothetical protein
MPGKPRQTRQGLVRKSIGWWNFFPAGRCIRDIYFTFCTSPFEYRYPHSFPILWAAYKGRQSWDQSGRANSGLPRQPGARSSDPNYTPNPQRFGQQLSAPCGETRPPGRPNGPGAWPIDKIMRRSEHTILDSASATGTNRDLLVIQIGQQAGSG